MCIYSRDRQKNLTSYIIKFGKTNVVVGTTVNKAVKLAISELRSLVDIYSTIIDNISNELKD